MHVHGGRPTATSLMPAVQTISVTQSPERAWFRVQDGMATQWDEAVIADLIEQERQATAADMVSLKRDLLPVAALQAFAFVTVALEEWHNPVTASIGCFI